MEEIETREYRVSMIFTADKLIDVNHDINRWCRYVTKSSICIKDVMDIINVGYISLVPK